MYTNKSFSLHSFNDYQRLLRLLFQESIYFAENNFSLPFVTLLKSLISLSLHPHTIFLKDKILLRGAVLLLCPLAQRNLHVIFSVWFWHPCVNNGDIFPKKCSCNVDTMQVLLEAWPFLRAALMKSLTARHTTHLLIATRQNFPLKANYLPYFS